MNTIWKFQLPFAFGETQLLLPKGATLLSAHAQDSQPVVWALVDDALPATEPRTVRVVGTGHNLPVDVGRFIGTCLLLGRDSLVMHVFEIT